MPALSVAATPDGSTTAEWRKWKAKCDIVLAARKHGLTASEQRAWESAVDAETIDSQDTAVALGIANYSLARTLSEKSAGLDNSARSTASLSAIPTLPPHTNYDGTLGSGFSGAWSESQVGSSGGSFGTTKPIARPLCPSRALIHTTGIESVGIIAIHANGIDTVTAACEGGTTATTPGLTYNPDIYGSGVGAWGYWFHVDADDWSGESDGPAEIRFKATPNADGVERVLSGFEVIINEGGTIPIPHVVVDSASGNDGTGVASTTKATAAANPFETLKAAMNACDLSGWLAGEDGGGYVWLKAGTYTPGGLTKTTVSAARRDITVVPYVIQPDTGVATGDCPIIAGSLIVEDTSAAGSGETSTMQYDRTADTLTFTRNGSGTAIADAATKTCSALKTEIEAITGDGATYVVTIVDTDDDIDKTFWVESSIDLNESDEGHPKFLLFEFETSGLRSQRTLFDSCTIKMPGFTFGSAFSDESSLLGFIGCAVSGAGKKDTDSNFFSASDWGASDEIFVLGGSLASFETINGATAIFGATVSDIQDIQSIRLLGGVIEDTSPIGGTHTDAWQFSTNSVLENYLIYSLALGSTSYTSTQGLFFESVGSTASRCNSIGVLDYVMSRGGQCSFNMTGNNHLLHWSTFTDKSESGQGNWWLNFNPDGTGNATYTDVHCEGCLFENIAFGESGTTVPLSEVSFENCHVKDSASRVGVSWIIPGTFNGVTEGATVG